MVDEANLEQNTNDETKDDKKCLKILDIWEDANCLNALQKGNYLIVFLKRRCARSKRGSRIMNGMLINFFSKNCWCPNLRIRKGSSYHGITSRN
jgi:hypothetical protein